MDGLCLTQKWLFALLFCIGWNLLSCSCWIVHRPMVSMEVWLDKGLRAPKVTSILCYSSENFGCMHLNYRDHNGLNVCQCKCNTNSICTTQFADDSFVKVGILTLESDQRLVHWMLQIDWFTYQNAALYNGGQWLVSRLNTLQYLALPEWLS